MKLSCWILIMATGAHLASARPPADVQSRLEQFAKAQPGGIAVAWVDPDGAVFLQAGKFSRSDQQPITPDTQFEIGSVTKVFTALLLAESERLGKVGRDEPVATYLLPADDDDHPLLTKITLGSLATHTSGLPRLASNFSTASALNPYVQVKRGNLVEGLRLDGPKAQVGRSVLYSNFGVALLGEALAEAWRSGYDEALRARVLDPLGMDRTVIAMPGTRPSETLAPGHNPTGDSAPNWELDAYAPAGALRSSTRELAKFLSAALGGEAAPLQAAFKATTIVQHPAPDLGGSVGLGWFITADVARPIFWHNGGTAGYRSFVGFTRAHGGVAVAVLTNHAVSVDALGFALLGGKPAAAPLTTIENAADYIGRYPLGPGFNVDITVRGRALFAQATGQGRLALRPGTATDRFEVVGVAAEVGFERDAKGKVTALVLRQNGVERRGAWEELPLAPREISLSAETLQTYAGEFRASPQLAFKVLVHGNGLFVQLSGQAEAPVFATAMDEFFYKIVDARISFTRDAAGKVTGLVLHQGGQDVRAMRVE